jgi:hypothetical protein
MGLDGHTRGGRESIVVHVIFFEWTKTDEAYVVKSEPNHVLDDQQQQKLNFLVPVTFGMRRTQKTVLNHKTHVLYNHLSIYA